MGRVIDLLEWLKEKPRALNKVDVTHRQACEPGVLWLVSNGYRMKFNGHRVFLVRQL